MVSQEATKINFKPGNNEHKIRGSFKINEKDTILVSFQLTNDEDEGKEKFKKILFKINKNKIGNEDDQSLGKNYGFKMINKMKNYMKFLKKTSKNMNYSKLNVVLKVQEIAVG